MANIPEGLGDVDSLLARYKHWRGRWELWRTTWQDAAEYAIPERETFTAHSPGQKKNIQVYDSTAVQGVQIFASRIQGAVLPPWQRWIKFEAGSDISKDDAASVAEGLETTTETVLDFLNHSNFYTEVSESFIDLSLGTGGILVEEGDGLSEPLLRFTSMPLAHLVLEAGHDNRIQSFWREENIVARNLVARYPEAEWSERTQEIIKSSPNKSIRILDANLHTPHDGLYHQLIIEPASKHVAFSQTYPEAPGVVFRWSVTPGEVYGRGPVLQALPDILTLNKIKEFMLKNAALAISGMYTAIDDGVLNPYTVRVAPGVVIPVTSNSNQNPSIRPLESAGRFDVSELLIRDLQDSINQALFASPLGPVSDPVRSATENMIRMQESLRRQGASFGRLWSELVLPLMTRVVGILRRNGKIPKIEVDGKEVTLRHVSPLAQSQNASEIDNFNAFMGTVAGLPPEVLALTVNMENIPRNVAETLGVWADVIRSPEEIKILKKQALAQIQAAQESGQLEEGGAAVA